MQEVIVIGGGVIGLTSAWWLLEAGHRVTLVEGQRVGQGSSYSNGGQLSYRYVSPLADAGVPLKALRWMTQEAGPLRFKLEADPRQWRWLLQFLAHCRADVNARTTARLLELGEQSRQAMARLFDVVPPAQFGWREAGKLVVYRSADGFAAARARAGSGKVLSPAECAALEPALADAQRLLAGGVYNAGEAVADCYAFCLALERRLHAHPRFGGIVNASVRAIAVEQGRVGRLDTDGEPVRADAYVLAAGIRSRDLAASAGIRLPLYPLKGYSLSAPIGPGAVGPQISVTDFERKVLYARIGDTLRIAAMVDMVGDDASIDPRRVGALTKLVRQTMPRAADYDRLAAWAGLRPATPSGAPIIGPTRYPNLWLNVGHGPLGFTFACGSAGLLARAMAGHNSGFSLNT
ncbi:MAG: D-amino acid dehydrogenase [Gammaproteobacteria bacterium]